MKYNYVFFDTGSIVNGKNNINDYYYICTEDLRSNNNIRVVSYPMDRLPNAFHDTWSLLDKAAPSALRVFYPLYFKDDFAEKKPFCFIVYGYYIRPDYLRYLKKKYPDCRIVKIHRDLIENWRRKNPDYTDNDIKTLFDLVLTYDKDESEKYGLPYFPEIESKIDIPEIGVAKQSDLFFAGNAKDRLPILLKIYNHAIENGLKCDFFLTGVRAEDRIESLGITYAEKGMLYRDMLMRSMASECILEINQGGAVGYTSRFLEAVMYGKKLLTNNLLIKNSKFYRPDYIQCFSDVENIDYSFISRQVDPIDYKYNNEFSPIHLIEQVEGLLANGKRD